MRRAMPPARPRRSIRNGAKRQGGRGCKPREKPARATPLPHNPELQTHSTQPNPKTKTQAAKGAWACVATTVSPAACTAEHPYLAQVNAKMSLPRLAEVHDIRACETRSARGAPTLRPGKSRDPLRVPKVAVGKGAASLPSGVSVDMKNNRYAKRGKTRKTKIYESGNGENARPRRAGLRARGLAYSVCEGSATRPAPTRDHRRGGPRGRRLRRDP